MAKKTIVFKSSRSGYNALMNSAPVQSIVQGGMQQVANTCNASYSHGIGYESGSFQGKRVRGAWCHTIIDGYAVFSEHKHNRLIKALAGLGV